VGVALLTQHAHRQTLFQLFYVISFSPPKPERKMRREKKFPLRFGSDFIEFSFHLFVDFWDLPHFVCTADRLKGGAAMVGQGSESRESVIETNPCLSSSLLLLPLL